METNKIPTAEEWLFNLLDRNEFVSKSAQKETIYAMQEFAKLHVKAALEAAVKNSFKVKSEATGEMLELVTKQSILNSYNYDNIK